MEEDSVSDGEKKAKNNTKKRKSHGRVKDVSKKIKLMSHEMGNDCLCRLRCFDVVPRETRLDILKQFNLLGSNDAQNS